MERQIIAQFFGSAHKARQQFEQTRQRKFKAFNDFRD
jgi:hypothetical protein